ncbi:uncharacterized protein LOC125233166 [Leguminivora glycinivorella]|uniref:uncharacterized protein LOC125233166 n=1 Tax=Leguminivora glycinivorella TaxID=1035111 RepID=UPI00200E6D1F|nr:uncharacterized protein LOC125233166 [Leguminivora glycinivorella]
MMSLLFAIAVIVTILIFTIFRDNLIGLAGSNQNSRGDGKEKEYGCVFMYPQDKRKKMRDQTKKVSHCKTQEGVASCQWFPKHKTDPRIFVDDEEIGQEPVVN